MVSAVDRVIGPSIPIQPKVEIFLKIKYCINLAFCRHRAMLLRVSANFAQELCLVSVKFLPMLKSAILRASSVQFARRDSRRSREHRITLVSTSLLVRWTQRSTDANTVKNCLKLVENSIDISRVCIR